MTDQLLFIDPVLDTQVALGPLAWGPVAPGSASDQYLRLRNNSSTFTAVGVELHVITVFVAPEPPPDAQILMSSDGRRFTGVLDLGDLPPLTATAVITVRRVTPAAVPAGDYTIAVRATASAWE